MYLRYSLISSLIISVSSDGSGLGMPYVSQRKTLGQYLVRKVQRLYVAASCQLQTFVSSIALKTSLLTFALSSFRVPLLSRASLRATRVRKGQGSEKLDEEGSKDIRVSVLLSNLKWYHSSTLVPQKREKGKLQRSLSLEVFFCKHVSTVSFPLPRASG